MGVYTIITIEMNLNDLKNAKIFYSRYEDDLKRALRDYRSHIADYEYDDIKREEKEFPDFKNHPSITIKQATIRDGDDVHIIQLLYDEDDIF